MFSRNDYNHVTATYFLLAERKLRSQRQDTARRARTQKRAVQAGQSKKNEVQLLNFGLVIKGIIYN
jgi:hypothetical protein